ncbi:Hypothetical predicted protein [Pelobates cultripes]|uniref:Uncharacterized protein n=1 Tax=Pelobates cultripes TaxID=61616 RepID=A0AAD1SDR7_PELCU|nr:Hypothetical predicted protein [Pelobates cultripes]
MLYKPEERKVSMPRDILIRFHYYSTKEAIVKYGRDNVLQFCDTELAIYQNLSPTTLQCRKEWRPAAELLRRHETQYTWGHPFKLVAVKADKIHTLMPGTDPIPFFRELIIEPSPDFTLHT